jgi:GTP-binding protein
MAREAQFICSAMSLDDCPRWSRVEVAFAGRSNVGKSSLLNALAQSDRLAKTSKTPGRTRSINYFTFGSTLALVDLPGFGYAKMSQSDASRLGKLLEHFLQKRINLAALILLVDARRGPREQELSLIHAAKSHLEVIVAATKCDKLRQSERAASWARFAAAGLRPIMCSSRTGEGISELRKRVLQFAQLHESHGLSDA